MNKNAIRRRRRGSSGSLAGTLFSAAEPGFTFEPWDITTLYQDRAGTTPVTAAGQSVGMRLDKSKGLALGAELVTNGDFSDGATGWTGVGAAISPDSGTLRAVGAGAGSGFYGLGFPVVSGASYKVVFSIKGDASYSTLQFGFRRTSSLGAFISATVSPSITTGYTTVSCIIQATSSVADAVFFCRFAGTEAINIDNISVRELAGNHEVAVNDAKRGIYGWMPKTGRRNLLNATETLATQSVTVTAAAHTLAFTGTGTVTLSGASTAGPLIGTGASNRVTLTFTPTAGSLTLTVTGSVTLAQLQLGSVDTAYQRVNSQYDVTEAGVPTCYYVQPDGVDDAYATPTITPGIDKVQVFAGIRKLSNAATAIFMEFSATASTNAGTFYVTAPEAIGASSDIRFKSRGSVDIVPPTSGAILAPTTKVITGLGDISGDTATLRVNGAQVAQSTADQGTGNYLAYQAYIYGRAGTSLPFNGLDFGHAVRFGPNLDAATIARVEALIARNTPEVTL